jgi:hypothetical protein
VRKLILKFFCRWTDQCPNEHDKNRLVPGFPYVGQNMADSWSSVNSPEKDLAGKVTGWYDEVVIFKHVVFFIRNSLIFKPI